MLTAKVEKKFKSKIDDKLDRFSGYGLDGRSSFPMINGRCYGSRDTDTDHVCLKE
jgi:hypothetical protein